MVYNSLSPQEEAVIIHKETEAPFTGKYDDFYQEGTFICHRCNAPLFSSESKFDARCGWPVFDKSYPKAIARLPDPDGLRTEVQCANCGGHLGHEFIGENLTATNTRECINSLSITFIAKDKELPNVIQNEK